MVGYLYQKVLLTVFVTMKDKTNVIYKVDSYYNKDSEKGIKWDDDFSQIDWPIDREKIIFSEKDSCLPLWKNIREEINSWSWN